LIIIILSYIVPNLVHFLIHSVVFFAFVYVTGLFLVNTSDTGLTGDTLRWLLQLCSARLTTLSFTVYLLCYLDTPTFLFPSPFALLLSHDTMCATLHQSNTECHLQFSAISSIFYQCYLSFSSLTCILSDIIRYHLSAQFGTRVYWVFSL